MQRARRNTLLIILFVASLTALGVLSGRFTPREPTSSAIDRPLPAAVDELHIDGRWTVSVHRGESASIAVELSRPALTDRYLDVDGDSVTLRGVDGVRNAEARIILPSLQAISVDGTSDITIGEFDLDTLDIDIDGAARIEGIDLTIHELEIETDGAARVDLSASHVVEATIDIDGAGNIDITMGGGALTGSIDGVGRVAYGGEVSREDIDIDGLGTVEPVER